MRFQDGSKATRQRVDRGGGGWTHLVPRTGWPPFLSCRLVGFSPVPPCPVYLVALNSKLFLESPACEGLGVYIENKSWWLFPLPVAKSTQQNDKDYRGNKSEITK